MSRLSEATKKQMYDHAVEVIEVQTENREREVKGISGDSTRICNLYDISDWMFSAERVKSLLDELNEAYAQLTAYKKGLPETADREMLKRLAVILSGSDTPGEIRSLTVTAQSFVDRCKALAAEKLYPEKLPCPVRLEPGLIFGKGVTTSTMLAALQRRAEYHAELDAMTPEERAKHDASIEEFKAMFSQGDMPLSVRSNGEANSYTLLKDGNWFANILMNGEMTVPQQWDFLNTIAKKQ